MALRIQTKRSLINASHKFLIPEATRALQGKLRKFSYLTEVKRRVASNALLGFKNTCSSFIEDLMFEDRTCNSPYPKPRGIKPSRAEQLANNKFHTPHYAPQFQSTRLDLNVQNRSRSESSTSSMTSELSDSLCQKRSVSEPTSLSRQKQDNDLIFEQPTRTINLPRRKDEAEYEQERQKCAWGLVHLKRNFRMQLSTRVAARRKRSTIDAAATVPRSRTNLQKQHGTAVLPTKRNSARQTEISATPNFCNKREARQIAPTRPSPPL
ncbi:hypothetical protein BKA64DRAFT_644548 [Cadophora sp. MPI-SDFR-AT-0126]|nr:hypothetical protein BKA64DRAFT_644548 [Leotiomycetes sp. MPI-SDFR-AT-0126]